ncbi:SRSO17 transposase [Paraburkholderia caledonica]|uniref:SRSO17 transposase n=1 Tax=Paraburkholderia caledonica TaxID=134536 RepID=A0AB73IHZ8_9BURK|nr:SRSO17 transposase [Paraburkholderia caledonica]
MLSYYRPEEATREPPAFVTKMHWRIERDCQDLKLGGDRS